MDQYFGLIAGSKHRIALFVPNPYPAIDVLAILKPNSNASLVGLLDAQKRRYSFAISV